MVWAEVLLGPVAVPHQWAQLVALAQAVLGPVAAPHQQAQLAAVAQVLVGSSAASRQQASLVRAMVGLAVAVVAQLVAWVEVVLGPVAEPQQQAQLPTLAQDLLRLAAPHQKLHLVALAQGAAPQPGMWRQAAQLWSASCPRPLARHKVNWCHFRLLQQKGLTHPALVRLYLLKP